MMPLVALCADEASMAHPELIGLADERLFAQPWLRLFTSGSEIRTFLRHDRAVALDRRGEVDRLDVVA